MTINQFIEKAIEGGYRGRCIYHNSVSDTWHYNPEYDVEKVFLDPKAWEAVGKVEGWTEHRSSSWEEYEQVGFWKKYQYEMHRMIDALIEGKTIEQFLETL